MNLHWVIDWRGHATTILDAQARYADLAGRFGKVILKMKVVVDDLDFVTRQELNRTTIDIDENTILARIAVLPWTQHTSTDIPGSSARPRRSTGITVMVGHGAWPHFSVVITVVFGGGCRPMM
jgi:hypothetical protein